MFQKHFPSSANVSYLRSKGAKQFFASCSFAHPRNISENKLMFPRLQGP